MLSLAAQIRRLAFSHDGKMRLLTLFVSLVPNSFAIEFSSVGTGTELGK